MATAVSHMSLVDAPIGFLALEVEIVSSSSLCQLVLSNSELIK